MLVYWVLLCGAVFEFGVHCETHNRLKKYLSGDDIVTRSFSTHKNQNRVKRGFSTVGTNPPGTKFIEASSKIKDVVNKIYPGDEVWKDFDRVFRGIIENYNTFHDNGNEIGDSPLRKAISESFLPVISVMSEFESIMCSLDEYVVSDSGLAEPMDDIKRFIMDFQSTKAEMKKLSSPDLFRQAMKIGRNSTFTDLKSLTTPTGNLLKTRLKELADRYLSPEVVKQDKISASCALADGTFISVSKAFFTLDLLSYFADGFYEKGDMEQYNNFFELVTSSYSDAKKSLIDKDSDESIQQVLSTLKVFNNTVLSFRSMKEKAELLTKKMEFLKRIQNHLETIELPVILDVPEKLIGKPDFEDHPIKTPIGQWHDGANVSYAVQYRHKQMYSRIGEWMEPITVSGEANPTLRLRVHPKRFDRLVFRKFNNQKPQLAGALEDKYQTEFRDISRDLYDAAARFGKKSVEDAEILINNGADIDAVFEGGRTAIHAAAQSDNVELARKFMLKPDNDTDDDMNSRINASDNEGHTPLHVASEGSHRRFIKFLLENGANVNAKTHRKQWTPLHIAADRGFVSTVKTLLKSQVIDVNARERGGFSPLHRAVGGGIPVLEVLMADSRTNVQATTDVQLNPLMVAIIEEYDDITSALLANKKVDINYKSNSNMTALAFAAIMGNTEIMQSLLKIVNVDVNVETIGKWSPLHLAMALKNDDAVRILLSMNQTDVDAQTSSQITALHIAAVTDQREFAENLIKHGAKIDQQTISGLAPIHLALLHKNYEVFNILVEGGTDVQAKAFDGSSLLHFAVKNNQFDIIQSLVNKGVDINATNALTGETPLHAAAKLGYLEVMKVLVQHGVDVNVKNKEGETPLHCIISTNASSDIFKFLTANGADLDSRDNLGRTPLHLAVQLSRENLVAALVLKGAKVNAKDYLGQTPLHMAAKKTDELYRFILNEADVDATDNVGQTPLHVAVNNGNEDIAMSLLKKGASVGIADKNSQTPLHLVVSRNKLSMLRLMDKLVPNDVYTTLTATSGYYPNLNTPLHLAIVLGRLTMMENIINIVGWNDLMQPLPFSLLGTAAASGKKGAVELLLDFATPEQYLSSSLCLSVLYGHLDIVEMILEQDVYTNGDAINNKDHPPVCCVQGESSILELLINKGANVDVKCPDGFSPLQKAARSGNTNVVKALMKHIYNDDDIGNQKLMQVLVQNGNMKEAKTLIDRGVIVNETDLGGVNLLHIMSQSGNLTEVKSLVDRGISVNATTHKMETALHFAARGGNKDIINYLLSYVDVNGKDSTGKTPLHWALESESVDLSVVESLVEHGAQLNLKCLRGKTPLHTAAQNHGSLHVVQYFLTKNADVDAKDFEGNTPLFDAVRSGNLDIVKSIVEAGADVRIVNNYRASPLHYLTSIQNGAFPVSSNDFNSPIFKHVSQPAMDIMEYLETNMMISDFFS